MFRYRPNQDKMLTLAVNGLMNASKTAAELPMQITE